MSEGLDFASEQLFNEDFDLASYPILQRPPLVISPHPHVLEALPAHPVWPNRRNCWLHRSGDLCYW